MDVPVAGRTARSAAGHRSPKLRVRWVSWCPSPYFVDRYTALAAHPDVEFEVLFMAARSSHQAWTLDESQWRFRYRILNPGSTPVGYYRPNRSLKTAWPTLRGGRGTVTILLYADLGAVLATTIARIAGRRVYLFVANTEDDARGGGRVTEAAKRFIFRVASGVLATGPLQARYAQRYAGHRQRVHLIGNPVDTRLLRRQAAELARDRDRLRRNLGWESCFVVAYVGRLAPEKGLEVLMAAAGRAVGRGVPVVVAIAGDGPMAAELRTLAPQKGVRADLMGFVEGRELYELYTAADAFVLPSRSEPWGLVVNEAMEFGLPVVVSDHVGCRHLIADGSSGFVVPTGDDAALADVLVRLAEDEALRTAVGAAGRARIEQETIERWVEAVVTALT